MHKFLTFFKIQNGELSTKLLPINHYFLCASSLFSSPEPKAQVIFFLIKIFLLVVVILFFIHFIIFSRTTCTGPISTKAGTKHLDPLYKGRKRYIDIDFKFSSPERTIEATSTKLGKSFLG